MLNSNRTIIEKIYTKTVKTYEQAATIYQETGRRLLERLDYIRIDPKIIIDVGCGLGQDALYLAERYPQAQIVALDLCKAMLQFDAELPAEKVINSTQSSIQLIQSDMQCMPFITESVDMIYANQSIQDVPDMKKLFQEFYRVLRPGGVLFFTTLGPDTLKELRQAWACVDTYSHINPLPDLHHIGDALLAQRFTQPVVDSEQITVHYREPMQLLNDLKAQGSYHTGPRQRRGLMGIDARDVLIESLEKQRLDNNKIPLTYEVIYGHAWRDKTQFTQDHSTGEVAISLDSLRRR